MVWQATFEICLDSDVVTSAEQRRLRQMMADWRMRRETEEEEEEECLHGTVSARRLCRRLFEWSVKTRRERWYSEQNKHKTAMFCDIVPSNWLHSQFDRMGGIVQTLPNRRSCSGWMHQLTNFCLNCVALLMMSTFRISVLHLSYFVCSLDVLTFQSEID